MLARGQREVAGFLFVIGATSACGIIRTSQATYNYYLYSANTSDATISAFTISSSGGALTQVTGSPFSAGGVPQSPVVAPSGKYLYVVNGNGTVSGFSITKATGALTAVTGSPFSTGLTGANSIAIDPAGGFVYVSSTSTEVLTSTYGGIAALSINSTTGALTPISGSPYSVSGVQSIFLSTSGRYLYAPSGTYLNVYYISSTTGALGTISSSPYTASNANSVVSTPLGTYLYLGNSSPGNAITAYSISSSTGALTKQTISSYSLGSSPGNITTDVSGDFLFVTLPTSNSIIGYKISSAGALSSITGSPFTAGLGALNTVIDPLVRYLYVSNYGTNTISGYTINLTTGALTELTDSPFTAGNKPGGLAIAKIQQDSTTSAQHQKK